MSASALMLALMLAGMGGVSADTYVDTTNEVSGVWNEADSPYIVNETIYVLAGQTLTIGPGVTMLFAPGAGIVINGTLAVEGTATNMVVFDEKDDSSGWSGLVFNEGSVGGIDHAVINNTSRAIGATNCELSITNSIITNTAQAVHAEFKKSGSLTIDNCFIDVQSGPEASIAVLVSGFADGDHRNVTAADITITNNLISSTSSGGLLNVSRSVEAMDDGIATIVADILVSGNEFNLLAIGGNLAHFYDRVYAEDEAAATILGNITYADNQAYSQSTHWSGMTYFERIVIGNDSSIASLIGDISICGNTFDLTSIFSDFIYMNVNLDANNNATAIIEGDFTAVRNKMLQTGFDTCYLYIDVWAGNDNSTARLSGDIVIDDNYAENVSYGPYVDLWLESDGYGKVCVVGNVAMNGNEIESAETYSLYYGCGIYAKGNSAVSVTGDVQMNDNTIDMVSGTGIKVDIEYDGTYEVGSVIVIRGNDITVEASGTGISINGGNVRIIDNSVQGGRYGAKLDGCQGIEVRGNTFKGNENGTYALNTEGIIIEGNAFLENTYGAYLYNDRNTTVRDNFFSKNHQQGLHSSGSAGLMVEDCYFHLNGAGAYLNNTVGTVGNNIFYMNLGNGLIVDGVSVVLIENNDITVGAGGTGISIENGEVRIIGNTIKSGLYGIYLNGAEGIIIDGNEFIENTYGAYLYNDRNTTVRDNFFEKNHQQGLRADGSVGLMVEDCYFYMNGNMAGPVSGGARLTSVTGTVGNNTFYMNLNGGLRILNSYLTLYNGEYDQNRYVGLNVSGGSVDWIIDAKAIVHANDVNFAGEIVISGTLVLDLADLELRPDGDVVHGIYAGHARLTVQANGCLKAYNSVLDGSTAPWYFEVYGTMELVNCHVSDAYEVYLASSDVEIMTSTIEDAYGNGIRIDGCSPIIRGCVISSSSMDGIYIVDASPTIVGCTIVGNLRGVYAFESCLDGVVDNILIMNGHGIYAERVTGTIHDNLLALNGIELFLIECDVDVMYNHFGCGRIVDMIEPLASAVAQMTDPEVLLMAMGYLGMEEMLELLLPVVGDSIGIYAIDSCVRADGNEYGMLRTAVYLVRSDMVFGDVIRTSSLDVAYANGTMLSIPFTVYDGIYAVDSTLTIRNAHIQVVDDAVMLESSSAIIVNSVLDAGDFQLYLLRDAEAAVSGPIDRYAILDSSRLYRLGELTVRVVDQDSFGIAGASVVVKDASGRVWSNGVTDRHGVFVAHAPHSLETRSGVNDSLGRCLVTAAYDDKASRSAEIDVDDGEITMKMTIKKSSLFGTDPLVLGIVALVIVGVLVGALMLARKK